MTKLSVPNRFWTWMRGAAAFGLVAGAGGWAAMVWAADVPFAVQAASPVPLPDTTVSAIAYIMIIGVLLAIVFVGAFLVLNVGLMSKRDRDRTGRRDPSDVGILKNTNYPQEAELSRQLPALDEDELDDDQPLAS